MENTEKQKSDIRNIEDKDYINSSNPSLKNNENTIENNNQKDSNLSDSTMIDQEANDKNLSSLGYSFEVGV